MKKVISFLLSVVMAVSIVGGLDFSAHAAEGTTYLSQEDIQFLTSKFSSSFTNSMGEKVIIPDTLIRCLTLVWIGTKQKNIVKIWVDI